jgi:hypothetical protein
MTTEPSVRVNLCPDCKHCPEVQVYPDRVLVGEAPNLAVLTPEQWSVLVQAVREGKFDQTAQGCDCPCEPGACSCGCCS